MRPRAAFKNLKTAFVLPTTLAALALLRPAEAAELRFTFIGNMAFHITDGSTTLLTDFPYESGAFGYMRWTAKQVPPVKDGLALITHRHRDHFAPEILGAYEVTVAGPADVLRLVADKKTLPLTPPVVFRGIAIHPRPTPHSNLEHVSYLVVWHGLRFYFSGDTEDPKDLLAATDLDIAFVSPWLLGSVRKQAARIDTRRIVVYHHRDGEAVPEHRDREVPRPGESFTIKGR